MCRRMHAVLFYSINFFCQFSGTAQSCDASIPITPPNIMQWLLRQLEGKEVPKFPTIDQVTDRLQSVIKVMVP